MPGTARQHFDEDIKRAAAIHGHGVSIAARNADLAGDLYRSAVAAAVGAMDAYLCDAYVDCLTRAMTSCRNDSTQKLPSDYRKELLPAGPLIDNKYTKRVNWALRMAARARMEKDNLLQIGRVKDLFNPVLPAAKKLWVDIVDQYVNLNRVRLTGIDQATLAGVAANKKQKAKEKAAAAVLRRIGSIIQRRHDIVHNCDRPKTAIRSMTSAEAQKMIADIRSFVETLDDHLAAHRTF